MENVKEQKKKFYASWNRERTSAKKQNLQKLVWNEKKIVKTSRGWKNHLAFFVLNLNIMSKLLRVSFYDKLRAYNTKHAHHITRNLNKPKYNALSVTKVAFVCHCLICRWRTKKHRKTEKIEVPLDELWFHCRPIQNNKTQVVMSTVTFVYKVQRSPKRLLG